jgi:hypothetical protein
MEEAAVVAKMKATQHTAAGTAMWQRYSLGISDKWDVY